MRGVPLQNLPTALTAPRSRALALCALPVLALFAVAAFVPLPYTVESPGITADTLGRYNGRPVITITGAQQRTTEGQLRMVTISATEPGHRNSLRDSLRAWVDPEQVVVPTEEVYPQSNPKQANEVTQQQMTQSRDDATTAALGYLHLSPDQVKVTIDLGDIGGPSAGQMLALGIVDKIAGDGRGGDLTGGRTVAGTGTIDSAGRIGPVGGVPLKTQAAARDGATVFLLPRSECTQAKVNTPDGLQLVPVDTLAESVAALQALHDGGAVPHC
ncbi:S16 family serine protease [Kitasatospora sp. CB02891]|uniref:S16 family serine protease n=1 Tax=Kitasatospora sp. CB02891 TaxID=2020329 RepID=UPI001E4D6A15|nr:S16 family serine protease [Kitasatospora sp. CB02891]